MVAKKVLQALGRNAPYVDVQPPPVPAQRAPLTTDDDYAKGQLWLDESVSPVAVYTHVGSGTWDQGGNADATTTVPGIVLINTDGTLAGADDSDVPTSLAVKTYADALAIAGAPAWNETVSGIGQLSTSAEATTGTNDTTAMTPLKVAAVLAAPPAIGSGTPAAGSFTTLAASGLASLSGSATITTGATALNLASDASTGAVNIGTGADARTITIGNVSGATAVAVNTGTGHFTVTTTGAGDIILNSDDTMLLDADGVLELNSSGGVIGIGNDADAQNINIGTGAAARTITIGNGTGATSVVINSGTGAINVGTNAFAHSITIGNVTGATAVAINVGTGNFALEGDVASTYDISATGVNTGTVRIASGTGARTVEIAGGGTGAKTINIGAAASADVITIGTNDGASSLTLAAGTGNFSLDGAATTDYTFAPTTTSGLINFGGTGANTGTMTIAGGTGAQTVNIANSTGGKTVNIAAGAGANLVTIGSVTGASSLDLLAGTGNFTLEGDVATTYAISNTGANTGQVDIAGGSGARTVNIAGSTGGKTVNIAAGAGANLVTIGSVTGASSLDLLCGTGNFTLEGNVASTYDISATGINTGTVRIGSGTGARTVEIAGGGTGIKTINIGRGATADVISIGTTDGAGSLTLAAGTGDITMSGTVKEINAEFLFASGTDLTVTQSPILQSNADTGAAPTGGDTDVNLMYMQDGCLMEQYLIGAATIIAPRMTANGLNLALDQTVAEGSEYNFGARANAKHAYTIGTSAAFFMEATFYVTDYSGCAPLMMGFRRVAANNSVLADYTDYALIGINNATSALNATILSELNSGGQTATDTTDALAAEPNTFTLKVLVSAAGVTTFEVNGSAASAAPAYTFDNGDVVMPCIHILQGADLSGEIGLRSLKIGFQA